MFRKVIIISIIVFLFQIAKVESKKPNIILFYVDDLGWMDLSCQGSKFYETPQIDKLASEGVRFTQAYTAHPRCVPARYGLITGKYPARGKVPGGGELRPDDFTIAEALQAGGYRTFFTGKWHLLFQEGLNNMPEKQGFDVNVAGGAAGSPPTYFYPYRKGESTQNGRLGLEKTEVHGLEDGSNGEYITDRITDETIHFMKSQVGSNPNQPFFVYLSHYGVHTPFEAKSELIKKYEEKLKNMEYDLPSYTQTKNGDTKLRQNFPIYAAMIESVDESMGRINQTLTELGIEDNTIIIFTADNGGLSSRGNTRTLATSNYPLKNGKGWLNEGGIREAFIVKWPNVVQKGSTSNATTIGTDIYPTVLEMANLPQQPNNHLDGESIVKALKGETFQRSKPLFWHSPAARPESTGDDNSSAYREGDYKLIHWYDENKVELFNLKDDIGEANDLSATMPTKKEELFTKMQTLKTEVINWKPEIEKSYDFENFPYIDDFEADVYTIGNTIAKFEGDNESDAWIETSPKLIDRFWRGKATAAYACEVSSDANSGAKAIKIQLTTKVGESPLKLRSVNLPPAAYKVSFYAKTDALGDGKTKVGFSANAAALTTLTSTYQKVEGTVTVKENTNGSTRLMLAYFSDGSLNTNETFTIYLDDLRVEKITTSVKKTEWPEKLKIFPNPAKNKIRIKGTRPGDTLQVCDMNGRILRTKTTNLSQLDVSQLKGKRFIIAVNRNGKTTSLKFKKQ